MQCQNQQNQSIHKARENKKKVCQQSVLQPIGNFPLIHCYFSTTVCRVLYLQNPLANTIEYLRTWLNKKLAMSKEQSNSYMETCNRYIGQFNSHIEQFDSYIQHSQTARWNSPTAVQQLYVTVQQLYGDVQQIYRSVQQPYRTVWQLYTA